MTKLILIRHGETLWNLEKRYQGQGDSPLSPLGREQAEKTGKFLASEDISAVYCSDLKRAVLTAEAISKHHQMKPIITPQLREIAFGSWEGLTQEEIKREYPDILAARDKDRLNIRIPGAELPQEVVKRMRGVMEELPSKHKGQTIAIVAHGGSLRLTIASLLHIPLEKAYCLRLDNGGISQLFYRERDVNCFWEITALNCTVHLQ
ncbi:MAG: histidine phosphatase family protein [Firmicutes bacterium]|nr:histidine phosphatase family protein [Bacillota bacterium]